MHLICKRARLGVCILNFCNHQVTYYCQEPVNEASETRFYLEINLETFNNNI
jgi:hypothetical protein